MLDLQHNIFLGLNRGAMDMWHLLAEEGESLQEATVRLAERTHTDSQRILADLTAFATSLSARGILLPASAVLSMDRQPMQWNGRDTIAFPRGLEGLEAYFTLRRIDHILRTKELLPLIHHITAFPDCQPVTDDNPVVRRLIPKIRMAAAWLSTHPQKTACLPQSLALCWMLRRRHILANLVIGVYTHPFSAHAWVVSTGIIQWQAGLAYPDEAFLRNLTVIFHSGEVRA